MSPSPLSPALPMTAAMRARHVGWRVAAQLRRVPGGDSMLARLAPSTGWGRFVPTAATAAAVTVAARDRPPEAVVHEAAALLRRHGVVVLTDLFDPAVVVAARGEAELLLAPVEAAAAAGCEGEPGGRSEGRTKELRWVVHRKGSINLRGIDGPLVSICAAGGDDAGNIGVTHIADVARVERLAGLSALITASGQAVVDAIVARLHPSHTRVVDLLKKPGVARPQRAHVDTDGSFFYAFLYLNDIRELKDGPYAYLPGSHRREDLLARDLLLNRAAGRPPRDLPALSPRLVPMMGEAGTVVLSCQRGVHGGLPQLPGRVRWALQTSYL